MCHIRKSAVLVTFCYFAMSWWSVAIEATVRHDGPGAEGRPDDRSIENSHVGNCSPLVNALNQLNVDRSGTDAPLHKTFVSDLEICNNHKKSCCTRNVEEQLRVAAIGTTHSALRSATSYLNQFLSDNHLHYQDQFVGMLRLAENETQNVLKTVYKIDRKDWRTCLDDLFIDLSAYLNQRDGDVTESLTKFYNQLFPVIFQFVLNDPSVVDLDVNYQECLMEARQDLTPQPFGDAPTKLAHGLTESLRAARVFLSTLALGAELLNVTAEFDFEQQCSHALTRLEYCSLCEGLEGAQSCRPLCQNVMRGCLSGVVGLERHWDSIINQLQVLGSSMKGNRDVEEVLDSFPTRVSESIMHSMETAHKYYEKILSTCGHPKTFQNQNFSVLAQPSRRRLPNFPQKAHNHRPKLHSKIEMMMRNVIASKGFLSKLPDAMCNSDRFPIENCWNGTAMGLYKQHVPANVLAAQVAENPEMKVRLSATETLALMQKKLDNMHKLLTNIVGDVEPMQSDASYSQFESSGSNRRYRNNNDDDDDDDFSDDEDIDVGSSGSGYDEHDHENTNVRERHPHDKIPNGHDGDFSFVVTTTRRSPYYTNPNQQSRSNGFNSGLHLTPRLYQLFYASLILQLLLKIQLS